MTLAIESDQPLERIAQLLIQEKFLDKTQALKYQKLALQQNQSFLYYFSSQHPASEAAIATLIASHFSLPLLDLDALEPSCVSTTLIDKPLIKRHRVIPLSLRGQHLFLALDDPSKQTTLKEIKFHTGLHVTLIIVETLKLNNFIATYIDKTGTDELTSFATELLLTTFPAFPDKNLMTEDNDAPIIKFVNHILLDAIQKQASDIHFEPYEQIYRIRYRLDGLLTEIATPPLNLASRITSRIKVMANLDISERRLPLDGRFKMKFTAPRPIDFRVSTCPTINGEKVVIRILDPNSQAFDIETLGFNAYQKKHFLDAITKPQGLILVTGPTGSGKTVSLYTVLNILNTDKINISTAEDPVEVKIQGINQVPINPKAGLTFSTLLRAFLRQDPDVIMIGEIRDLETAEIAIKAAQTGHLVLSTVHANSAAETLTRLSNMGVSSFNLASSISLVIAQRLARRLCNHCKIKRFDLSLQRLEELGITESIASQSTFYSAGHCKFCFNGYRGRVGLFEIMPISKTISQLILTDNYSKNILEQAQKEGMITLYQSGLEKFKYGITTLEEIMRVTLV